MALLFAPVASAQTSTPEEVAAELSQAYKDFDLERAASLMHSDALTRLQEIILEIASVDSTGEVAAMFTGETDMDVINSMSAETAFVRFFEALMQIQPEIAEAFKSLETEVLGHITEGEDLAHVVTRGTVSMMGMEMTQMEVITLQRDGNEWRALLSGDLNNFAEAVRANLSGQ